MRVVDGMPPNFVDIAKRFNLNLESTIFTYGDTIFTRNPDKLPDHIIAHESVHARQQTNPKKWWKKYLIDDKFRLEQELEAYRAQYIFIQKHVKDREKLFKFAHILAKDFSGEMYGNIITFQEALSKITQHAPIH